MRNIIVPALAALSLAAFTTSAPAKTTSVTVPIADLNRSLDGRYPCGLRPCGCAGRAQRECAEDRKDGGTHGVLSLHLRNGMRWPPPWRAAAPRAVSAGDC